jgi:plastocyanin
MARKRFSANNRQGGLWRSEKGDLISMPSLSLAARATMAAALLAVVGVIAGPAIGARTHTTGAAVTVTATEFHFKLSKTSVPHGSVTFTVVNKGKVSHDFKIGGKKTTLIKPGKSAKLTVTLKAGKAAYLCTVPGHSAAGMKGTLTVK